MKIMVTGGAGFIGSHLVDRLIELDHNVVIVDNLISGKRENINHETKFYELDILDEAFSNIVVKEKPSVVFHLASVRGGMETSIDDVEMDKSNILGTLKVLDVCIDAGVKKIVYASSIDVYGNITGTSINEQETLVPKTNYALSKYIPEKYVKAYSSKYELDYSILRISNVYGKRMTNCGEGRPVFNLIKEKKSKQTSVADDYVYIKDVVDALVRVVSNGEKETYNVGFGVSYKLNKESILPDIIQGHSSEKLFQIDKAKKDLGYDPRYDLYSGLKDMNYSIDSNLI